MKTEKEYQLIPVSNQSKPSAVAGAIAATVRIHGKAEVQGIGAGSVNQMVKAIAIARDYLQESGINITAMAYFMQVQMRETTLRKAREVTAMRFVVSTVEVAPPLPSKLSIEPGKRHPEIEERI